MKAAKLVYEEMSVAERKEIDDVIADERQHGGDLDTRHRIAGKKGRMRVKQWSKKSWVEMGLFTLTFFGHMTEDGRYLVQVFEEMAKNMEVTTLAFMSQYKDQIMFLLQMMGKYMKSLINMKKNSASIPGLAAPNSSTLAGRLSILAEGYPILPDEWPDGMRKRDFVGVMRESLNAHYGVTIFVIEQRKADAMLIVLASAKKRKHVPFARVEASPETFILAEYLPAAFAFKDPHNLQKEGI
ncbi:hypothetical protein NP233_g11180 [Leucocoprinus birnbaumii]|uniref:Uncharacterized protein n=1 Tax=Leucocoprinus birnbaumii TaxID=56174 RepID=A0AAD5VKQ7_9AGAR|nr:hypothetical protein NP233_g11180 [Leucocoprinus birnbaumii]